MVLEPPCFILFFSLKFEVAFDKSAIVSALHSCPDPAESMETWHSVVPLLFTSSSSVLTGTRGTKQLVNAPATRCAAALNEPLLLTWEDRAL